jgi:hypothetical protein
VLHALWIAREDGMILAAEAGAPLRAAAAVEAAVEANPVLTAVPDRAAPARAAPKEIKCPWAGGAKCFICHNFLEGDAMVCKHQILSHKITCPGCSQSAVPNCIDCRLPCNRIATGCFAVYGQIQDVTGHFCGQCLQLHKALGHKLPAQGTRVLKKMERIAGDR